MRKESERIYQIFLQEAGFYNCRKLEVLPSPTKYMDSYKICWHHSEFAEFKSGKISLLIHQIVIEITMIGVFRRKLKVSITGALGYQDSSRQFYPVNQTAYHDVKVQPDLRGDDIEALRKLFQKSLKWTIKAKNSGKKAP